MPFGHGPRNCVGISFALLLAKVALVRVLSSYTLRPNALTPFREAIQKTSWTIFGTIVWFIFWAGSTGAQLNWILKNLLNILLIFLLSFTGCPTVLQNSIEKSIEYSIEFSISNWIEPQDIQAVHAYVLFKNAFRTKYLFWKSNELPPRLTYHHESLFLRCKEKLLVSVERRMDHKCSEAGNWNEGVGWDNKGKF